MAEQVVSIGSPEAPPTPGLAPGDAVAIRRRVVQLSLPGFAALLATMTVGGALRGAGDTRSVLYVTAFAVWVVRLSVTYLLVVAAGLGLSSAWLAMVADWLVRGGYVWCRFRAGGWKRLEV